MIRSIPFKMITETILEWLDLMMPKHNFWKRSSKKCCFHPDTIMLPQTTCWQDTTQQSPDVLSWTFQTHWSLDR